MKLLVYPKYKYSGVEWLGDVPVHWKRKQLKFACSGIQTGGTPSPEYMDNADEKTVMWFTPADFSESFALYESSRRITSEAIAAREAPLFPAGTAFVVGIGATLGKVGFSNQPASANQQVNALLPHPDTDSTFLAFLLSTYGEIMQALANSATLPILNQQRMGDIAVVLPPLPEQRAIADYLDRETARLDGLVAAKERVLGLLAEKRRALITRAVIRGLNPTAPLRDSGIPWLGVIPAHWQIAGFTKYLRSLVDYRGKTPEKTDSGVFLVTARNIRNGYIDYEASQEYIEPDVYEETMQRGKPHIGELLLTTEAPLGQAALVDREDIALAQRVIKLDYESKVLLNEFALQWILSALFQWQLNSYATGSTALGIKAERLHMLRNVIPPLDEQGAIVAHIAKETAKLDALREATERTIRLLKERRAALIAAAVTGKLDVNRAA